jgi:hypothetical protein
VERVDSTAARAVRLLLAGQPLTEAKVRFVWAIVAGPAIARASTVTFADGTLSVRTPSDAWRQAIERARPAMFARLSEYLGTGAVTAIAVTSDDTLRRTLHHRP